MFFSDCFGVMSVGDDRILFWSKHVHDVENMQKKNALKHFRNIAKSGKTGVRHFK